MVKIQELLKFIFQGLFQEIMHVVSSDILSIKEITKVLTRRPVPL